MTRIDIPSRRFSEILQLLILPIFVQNVVCTFLTRQCMYGSLVETNLWLVNAREDTHFSFYLSHVLIQNNDLNFDALEQT